MVVAERHSWSNLPTDLLRTLVVIAESGSFSKAAERIGLSQPAISNQVKRLEQMLGDALFDRSSGRGELTDFGNSVLERARKFVELNDQMLSLAGRHEGRAIRIGVVPLFLAGFLQAGKPLNQISGVTVRVSGSGELSRLMSENLLDLICAIRIGETGIPIDEWKEDITWVRSRDFVVGYGKPIPLVSGVGPLEEHMAKTLEDANLSHELILGSSDLQARLDAVAGGIGITAIPSRFVPSSLIIPQ